MKGLTDVLALYPDYAEKFTQDLRHDLTYNLKDGYEEEGSASEACVKLMYLEFEFDMFTTC